MATNVDRECFRYCSETCPAVDSEFYDMVYELRDIVPSNNHKLLEEMMDVLLAKVKQVGTEKLRDALRMCVSDKQDAEIEAQSANDRCTELESKVDSLTSEILSLEKELESCQS
jgi:chromosome segregation ATPase